MCDIMLTQIKSHVNVDVRHIITSHCYLTKSRASDAQYVTCDEKGEVSRSPEGKATLSTCFCLGSVTLLLHLRLHVMGFCMRSGLRVGCG